MSPPLISLGRGGAGNKAEPATVPPLQPQDLETPVLRSPVITTGRGGAGNMVKNVDPAETRARQDVDPVRHTSSPVAHTGRGGAGNVVHNVDGEGVPVGAVAGAPDRTSQGSRTGAEAAEAADAVESESPTPKSEKRKSIVARGKDILKKIFSKEGKEGKPLKEAQPAAAAPAETAVQV